MPPPGRTRVSIDRSVLMFIASRLIPLAIPRKGVREGARSEDLAPSWWSGALGPSQCRRRHLELLAARQHLVDEAVLERRLAVEDLVALDVAVDLLRRTVGVLREGLLEPAPHPQHLRGLDLDVARLPATLTLHGGLVDEDPRVRQRKALAGRAGRRDHGRG